MAGMRLLRRGVPGLLAALALGAMPAAARPTASASGSTAARPEPTEHTFARWLDLGNYTLVPGGTFEGSLAGWKLTGGAKVVSGNESFNVHGAGEKHALSLPVGQLGDDAADVRRRPRSDAALLRGQRRRAAVAAAASRSSTTRRAAA